MVGDDAPGSYILIFDNKIWNFPGTRYSATFWLKNLKNDPVIL